MTSMGRRRFSYALTCVFIFCFVAWIFEFLEHSTEFFADRTSTIRNGMQSGSQGEEDFSRKTDAVIIYTSMRAGSSFFGDFFNRHEEVTYLFEPLCAQGFNCTRERRKEKAKLLRNLMHCNFGDLLSNKLNNKGKLCFSERLDFLRRSPDLCHSISKCPKEFDLDDLSSVCRQSLMPVAKLIRWCGLKDFESLLKDPQYNVKIIHLVRDPRAVMSSRLFLSRHEKASIPWTNLDDMSKAYCKQHLKDIKYLKASLYSTVPRFCMPHKNLYKISPLTIQEDIPADDKLGSGYVGNESVKKFQPNMKSSIYSLLTLFVSSSAQQGRGRSVDYSDPYEVNTCVGRWLWQNYVLLRYEDLIDDAITVSDGIFKFVGLNSVWGVRSWLNSLKQSDDEKSRVDERRTKYTGGKQTKDIPFRYSYQEANPFSLQKAHPADVWKEFLTPQEVATITRNCKTVIWELGYE